MHVVLFQPEIPPNTGSIARLCAATLTPLHLIEPLGFEIDDRHLKRAGLDYWENVKVDIVDNLESLLQARNGHFYFFSSKASKCYSSVEYTKDDWLIFGSETKGLPTWLNEQHPQTFTTIPMQPGCRCLNLANSCAVAVYEAQRQLTFTL